LRTALRILKILAEKKIDELVVEEMKEEEFARAEEMAFDEKPVGA